ncbi:MAG: thiol:disulfide interchange protein DsbA/DsbL [Usitatibacter sp.]
MNFRKTAAFAAALLTFAFAAWAQAPQQPFQVLSPSQPAEGGGKIEVVEFFWYGCPHCYSLESDVNAWLKGVPKDVVFKRVHAAPNEAWAESAKIYYTLESMGVVDQYHAKVFDAFHKENQNLANPRIREEWLKKSGIDVAKYHEVEKSFTVATKLQRAKQMTLNYKVDGVPRVFVNGRYYTAPELAGSGSRVFQVVDQLVAMARKEQTAAAPAATPVAKK